MARKKHRKKSKAETGPVPMTGICSDASSSNPYGPCEFRVVNIRTKEVLYANKHSKCSVNVGEFLALVEGLRANSYLPVYTDSQIAHRWAMDCSCRTKVPMDAATQAHVDSSIAWLRAHPDAVERAKRWNTRQWGEIPADFGRKGKKQAPGLTLQEEFVVLFNRVRTLEQRVTALEAR